MTTKDRKIYNKEWKANHSDYHKKYYKQWSAENKEHLHYYRIKRNYGITQKQYNELFLKQDGKCSICGTHQNELKYKLCVDHNHTTDEIRGLLCKRCNTVLGQLDLVGLVNFIKYLKINIIETIEVSSN
jgi:hypothetical protein